jgi:hypothetical protein
MAITPLQGPISSPRIEDAPTRGQTSTSMHAGAFHDELVRTKKGWRIAMRKLELYFGDALAVTA